MFKNTHPETITIRDIARGCSCNETTLSSKFVPPGGETILDVRWKLGTRRGLCVEEAALIYESAGAERVSVPVKFKAHVVPDVVYEPFPLPTFDPDKPSRVVVTFRRGRADAFELIGARVSQSAFRAEIDRSTSTVTITYDPTTPAGNGFGGAITVETGTTHEPEIVIPLDVKRGGERAPASPND